MVQSIINCTRCNVTRNFQFHILRSIIAQYYSTDSNDNKSKSTIKLPDPPSTCCMRACANCVWIDYTQKLTELFTDGGDEARKIILENVTDPLMQAFLMTELRNMKLKK